MNPSAKRKQRARNMQIAWSLFSAVLMGVVWYLAMAYWSGCWWQQIADGPNSLHWPLYNHWYQHTPAYFPLTGCSAPFPRLPPDLEAMIPHIYPEVLLPPPL